MPIRAAQPSTPVDDELWLFRYWDGANLGRPSLQRRRVIRVSNGYYWFKRPAKGFYASARGYGECWVQRYTDGSPGGGYYLTEQAAVSAYARRPYKC